MCCDSWGCKESDMTERTEQCAMNRYAVNGHWSLIINPEEGMWFH